uniref:CSON001530 protein n=1 Tax=Culicoides sonorensis TaxID=179676 RepID=A0A336KYI4_CULSO
MMAGNYANNLSAEPNSKRLCIQNQQESGDPSSMNRNQVGVLNNNNNGNINNNNSQEEPRRKKHEASRPNHILLFTILNPLYPITVEVLHTISQPHGQVQRIVIFKKNGVQAMIEFDSIESATRVRENLNGCDIYSGCCTLKIDYAKPEKLNVYKNDSDTSWDYTLDKQANGRMPLLQEPLFGARPQPYKPPLLGTPTPYAAPYATPEFHQTAENWKPTQTHATLIKEPAVVPVRTTAPTFVAQPQTQQGSVMMVYGLDNTTSNTDKLFNLVCLYGNVARIKFLKTKEGTAMVQMGDSVAVERCVQHLNNIPIGNKCKIQIAFSKQNFLSEVTNPFSLPDHSPSFKEYTGSKNNRFLSLVQASKNRIQPPSRILHFFNTPPDLTEEKLLKTFKDEDCEPSAIRMFPLKSERSSSGLVEFSTVAQAVLAIMKCNHAAIEAKGSKFPFIMKLCFSSSKTMNGAWNNEGNNENNEGEY